MGGDKFNFKEELSCTVERAPKAADDILPLRGRWHVEQWRDGKLIHEEDVDNTIVNAGKNNILGVYFHIDTPPAGWYASLIDNASFSAVAAADTMGSHAGWIENVAYSEGTRQAWGPGAASAQSITNGTAFGFTINANSQTIKGVFIASDNTKSGTSGILWSGAVLGSTIPANSGDILKFTYTVSC